MTNTSEPQAPAARTVPPSAHEAPRERTRGMPELVRRGLIAAGIATGVNLTILGIATAAGASMVVVQGGTEIAVGIMPVLVATFAPLALATIAAWLLAERWPRSTRILAWTGLVAAAASTILPLSGALDAGTGIALAVMHLVAGASWFAALVSHRRR
ncbi:hypothetical protein GCM10009640_16320 [Agrococcus citreus]|uniref:EamA-like transporter family protein n=2 Tax=Agrococcus citreus TaxID=84643 RepID=A0ABN1YUC9_9MICO